MMTAYEPNIMAAAHATAKILISKSADITTPSRQAGGRSGTIRKRFGRLGKRRHKCGKCFVPSSFGYTHGGIIKVPIFDATVSLIWGNPPRVVVRYLMTRPTCQPTRRKSGYGEISPMAKIIASPANHKRVPNARVTDRSHITGTSHPIDRMGRRISRGRARRAGERFQSWRRTRGNFLPSSFYRSTPDTIKVSIYRSPSSTRTASPHSVH